MEKLLMGKGIKVGITGLPGAGKTEAMIKVVEMLELEEEVIGGMVTEAIIENGRRVGFYVQDWTTKEKDVFAHVKFDSKVHVGRYKVDLDVLDRVGVAAIQRAMEEANVIIIDEVGKMEVESENFVKVVRDALETDKPMLLTLHKKSRNPLLQDIRRRDDIRILEVTRVNKPLLTNKIKKLMQGELL